MRSALFTGWVRHRRRAPVVNRFRYRVFQVYLDLAELDTVFRGRWLWSTRRPAPAWFRRADHLGDPARPLDACVRDRVARELGFRPRGAIRLLTHLRYWGYCMNPVSFYYCFAPAAPGAPESLEAVVAEVHNTPWGERHCYALDCRGHAAGGPHRFEFAKEFHVSPFMPMDLEYAWRFTTPGESLGVHMVCRRRGEAIFDATLTLRREEIGGRSLARALLAHPFMTGKVIAAIYWQALRLWLKRAPVHPHPGRRRTRAARGGRLLRRPGPLARLARALVRARLARLREGAVTVTDADGPRRFGAEVVPAGAMVVREPRFYRRAVTGGSLGFAGSYLAGEWTSDDLVGLLRVFARDIARHGGARWMPVGLARLAARLRHALRPNTRAGSRRNIRAHYDLGNDFYRLFLDDTLTYSCGLFAGPGTSMREASLAKLDLVCRKLALAPHHRVLEIGGGWGSFAIHAAGRYGCRVTTTTVSDEQRALATGRVRAAGLADRVTVLGRDYRDLDGRYDRLVSLEMIEAVGYAHLDAYFGACRDRLRPDGAMLLQAIVIPDRDEAAYRAGVDYIQRFVFPGSALPSLAAIARACGRAGELRILGVEHIGRHYVETLRRWRAAFEARLPEVRALGFDERFIRLWRYYLAYCEAGFAEGCVDDVQVLLGRPAYAAAPSAPAEGTSALVAAAGGAP